MSRDFSDFNGQDSHQCSQEEDQTIDDNNDECEEATTLSGSPIFDDYTTDEQDFIGNNEESVNSNRNSGEFRTQIEDNQSCDQIHEDLDTEEEVVETGEEALNEAISDNTISDTINSSEKQHNLSSNPVPTSGSVPKPTVRTIVPAIEVMPAPADDRNCGQNSGHNSNTNGTESQEVSHRRLERVGHPKNHRRTVSIGKHLIMSFDSITINSKIIEIFSNKM